MKYIVKYTFGRDWYTHSEHEDFVTAKRAFKALKKHVGTCGKVKLEVNKD